MSSIGLCNIQCEMVKIAVSRPIPNKTEFSRQIDNLPVFWKWKINKDEECIHHPTSKDIIVVRGSEDVWNVDKPHIWV